MCGIAGCSLPTGVRRNAAKVARTLLLGIEERGKDATGAAWYSPTELQSVYFQKDALPASQFVHSLQVPSSARTMVLHTRLATQGSPANNANNHPFVTGQVVGVHNGCLFNDDSLTTQFALQRQAETDSEAAFALLNEMVYGNTYDERKAERLKMLKEIQGSAALAWLDMRDPGQLHLARLNSSPVVWCQTGDGGFYFASTTSALLAMVRRFYGPNENVKYNDLDEGDYLVVADGVITERLTFEPGWSYKPNTGKWSSANRWSGYDEWKANNDKSLGISTVTGTRVTVPAPWALSRVNGSATTFLTYRASTGPVLKAHRMANSLTEKLRECGPPLSERQGLDGRSRDAYMMLLDLLSESTATDEDANLEAETVLDLLHADLQEGDRVITKFGTADTLAYVVGMGEFPNGDYELIANITTPGMTDEKTTVTVYRKWWEFTTALVDNVIALPTTTK